MKAYDLRCDTYETPIQIDNEKPRFGWMIPCTKNGSAQQAYEILMEIEREDGLREIVWHSGKVNSSQSVYITYAGKPLKPDTRYIWKVKYWDEDKTEASFSDETYFETGYMGGSWNAKWIGYDKRMGEPYDKNTPFYCADDFQKGVNEYYLPPVPYIRKTFTLSKKIAKAKVYVSAFGLAELWLNDKKVGSDYFVSGLSDYNKTVYAACYDVTGQLKTGENGFGILLADGWYAGYIGLNSREWYGSRPRVMAMIAVTYEDGTKEVVATDESWQASYGGFLSADIFQGETYDATRELPGFSKAEYQTKGWEPVSTGAENDIIPTAHIGVPVVEHRRIKPVGMIEIRENVIQLNFGTCFTGVLRVKLKGNRNSRICIRHAEWLNESGRLHLDGNRSAKCEDIYIAKGEGEEVFLPRFTYHGFQYAEITKSLDVELLEIEGIAISSQMEGLTEFTSSDVTLNRTFQMIRNTEACNRFEVPTDCCARDERLGWGMEGNHFLYAMTYMDDQEAFIRKWVQDIWDGQRENGGLEAIAPTMRMKDIEQFVGDLQSNHGVHMIYALYKQYGDTDMIEAYYDRMSRYFKFLEQNSDRGIRFATSCDWLGILEETNHSDTLHGYGDCSPAMIGTAHYAITVRMMEEMSNAVGKQEEARKYGELYTCIRNIYRLNFIQRDGNIRGGKQGDYLMALAADFIPEEWVGKAVEHLAEQLTKSGGIFWRGGTPTTPYFLRTLKRYGKSDLANRFLTQRTYPGIGYMQTKGASTIWERWDGIFEDNTLHPQAMNAMNHIGYTVIADYIISGVAGIDALEPGFKKILFEPQVTKEITSASASYQSHYGTVKSDWRWEDGNFYFYCTVPANTTARIKVPWDGKQECIWEEGEPLATNQEETYCIFEVASGCYRLRTVFSLGQGY